MVLERLSLWQLQTIISNFIYFTKRLQKEPFTQTLRHCCWFVFHTRGKGKVICFTNLLKNRILKKKKIARTNWVNINNTNFHHADLLYLNHNNVSYGAPSYYLLSVVEEKSCLQCFQSQRQMHSDGNLSSWEDSGVTIAILKLTRYNTYINKLIGFVYGNPFQPSKKTVLECLRTLFERGLLIALKIQRSQCPQ